MKKLLLLLLFLPIIIFSQNNIGMSNYQTYLLNKNLDNLHNNYIDNINEDSYNKIFNNSLGTNNYNQSSNSQGLTSYLSTMISSGCKLDIVLAFDVSGSNYGSGTCLASNQFLTSFLTELDAEMDGSITGVLGNNSVQVGLCTWSTLDNSLCDNGGQGANVQVSKMTTNASYLNSFATSSQNNEIITVPVYGSDFYYAATFMGMENLNDYANSSLGDRSGQPNYKRILIISTDANSAGACLQSTSGGPCAIDMQNDVWNFGVQTIAVAVRGSSGSPPFNWQAITSCLVEDSLDQYEGNGQTLSIVGQVIANDICIPTTNQANYCFNDSTFFSLNQNVDSISWDFGDPITGIDNYSDSINPFHIFSDTGTFIITAYYYNSSILDSLIDTIQIFSNPNLIFSLINPSCFGDSLGSIDLTVSGSVSPYTYAWNNGDSSEDLDSLIAGVYSVIVTDSNGCTSEDSILLIEPSPLVSSIQSTTNFNGFDLACFGDSLGSIDLTVSGSVSPYTYAWNNGDSSEDLDSLIASVYSVTITDQNGCIKEDSILLIEPSPLVSSIQSTTNFNGFDLACFGDSLGSIDLTVSGSVSPYTYAWNNGDSSEDLDSLIASVYSVIVTDSNGCTSEDSILLIEPSPLISSIQSTTNFNGFDLACFGDSLGSIDLTVSGSLSPYTYAWNNGDSSEDLDSLIASVYSVTISDQNGCIKEDSIILTEPTPLISSIQSTTNFNGFDLACFGDSLGSIDLTVSGSVSPYTYAWNNGDSSEDLDSLIAGIYSVIVTDSNGCTSEDSILLIEPSPLVSSIQSTTNFNGFDLACFGDSLGSIDLTVSGSVSPYTYAWNNGDSSEDLDSLIASVYSVTITDQNGCIKEDSILLIEPSPLVSSIQSLTNNPVLSNFNGFDLSCFGDSLGSIDLTVSGSISPYTYAWNNGDSSEDLDSLIASVYSVTITDQNGCIKEDSILLIEPSPLVSSIQSTTNFNGFDLACFGDSLGSIDLTVSGSVSPYTYAWNNGDSSEDLDSLIASVYSVTITDQNGCIKEDSILLIEPSLLVSSIQSTTNFNGFDLACFGDSLGSIDLTVSGSVSPYTYAWNNGDSSEDLDSLIAGIYSVIVTDSNGCTSEDSILLIEPSPLVSSIQSTTNFNGFDLACFGDSLGSIDLTVSGSLSPYTYAWNNGDSSEDLDSLIASVYSVTITDQNGCIKEDSIILTEPTPLIQSSLISNVTCNAFSDGNISVYPFGGLTPYNYLWNNFDTSQIHLNLTAGVYSVIISDLNNCVIFDTLYVEEPLALNYTYNTDSVNCYGYNDGNIDLEVNGGTIPYSFLWNTGDTTEDITNLYSNSYLVDILDSNNCLITASFNIGEPNLLFTSFNLNYVSCFGNNDGIIDATSIGGTLPYTYLWNVGNTTEDLFNVQAGIYILSISDANNCLFTDTVYMLEPDILNSSLTFTSGTLISLGSGGTPPYTYDIYNSDDNLWATASNNFGVEFIINPVLSGLYTLIVTDDNGCVDTTSLNIVINSTYNIDSITDLNVYPNPSKDVFNLTFKLENIKDISVRIINLVGEVVYKESKNNFVGEYTKQISLYNYSKGIYFLEIETNSGIVNMKLVLQ